MRGLELPDAVGEVGDFNEFISDKGLLNCVVIGVFMVVWCVVVFALDWDIISSWFFWLQSMMLCDGIVSIESSSKGWISSNCSMVWSALVVIGL